MVRSRLHIAALTALQSVDPHHRRRARVSTVSRGLDHASTNSEHYAPGTPVSPTDWRSAMARTSAQYRLFVGIDVAATTCAVSWMALQAQPTRAITIKQTPAGFAELERQLLEIEPDPNAVLIV